MLGLNPDSSQLIIARVMPLLLNLLRTIIPRKELYICHLAIDCSCKLYKNHAPNSEVFADTLAKVIPPISQIIHTSIIPIPLSKSFKKALNFLKNSKGEYALLYNAAISVLFKRTSLKVPIKYKVEDPEWLNLINNVNYEYEICFIALDILQSIKLAPPPITLGNFILWAIFAFTDLIEFIPRSFITVEDLNLNINPRFKNLIKFPKSVNSQSYLLINQCKIPTIVEEISENETQNETQNQTQNETQNQTQTQNQNQNQITKLFKRLLKLANSLNDEQSDFIIDGLLYSISADFNEKEKTYILKNSSIIISSIWNFLIKVKRPVQSGSSLLSPIIYSGISLGIIIKEQSHLSTIRKMLYLLKLEEEENSIVDILYSLYYSINPVPLEELCLIFPIISNFKIVTSTHTFIIEFTLEIINKMISLYPKILENFLNNEIAMLSFYSLIFWEDLYSSFLPILEKIIGNEWSISFFGLLARDFIRKEISSSTILIFIEILSSALLKKISIKKNADAIFPVLITLMSTPESAKKLVFNVIQLGRELLRNNPIEVDPSFILMCGTSLPLLSLEHKITLLKLIKEYEREDFTIPSIQICETDSIELMKIVLKMDWKKYNSSQLTSYLISLIPKHHSELIEEILNFILKICKNSISPVDFRKFLNLFKIVPTKSDLFMNLLSRIGSGESKYIKIENPIILPNLFNLKKKKKILILIKFQKNKKGKFLNLGNFEFSISSKLKLIIKFNELVICELNLSNLNSLNLLKISFNKNFFRTTTIRLDIEINTKFINSFQLKNINFKEFNNNNIQNILLSSFSIILDDLEEFSLTPNSIIGDFLYINKMKIPSNGAIQIIPKTLSDAFISSGGFIVLLYIATLIPNPKRAFQMLFSMLEDPEAQDEIINCNGIEALTFLLIELNDESTQSTVDLSLEIKNLLFHTTKPQLINSIVDLLLNSKIWSKVENGNEKILHILNIMANSSFLSKFVHCKQILKKWSVSSIDERDIILKTIEIIMRQSNDELRDCLIHSCKEPVSYILNICLLIFSELDDTLNLNIEIFIPFLAYLSGIIPLITLQIIECISSFEFFSFQYLKIHSILQHMPLIPEIEKILLRLYKRYLHPNIAKTLIKLGSIEILTIRKPQLFIRNFPDWTNFILPRIKEKEIFNFIIKLYSGARFSTLNSIWNYPNEDWRLIRSTKIKGGLKPMVNLIALTKSPLKDFEILSMEKILLKAFPYLEEINFNKYQFPFIHSLVKISCHLIRNGKLIEKSHEVLYKIHEGLKKKPKELKEIQNIEEKIIGMVEIIDSEDLQGDIVESKEEDNSSMIEISKIVMNSIHKPEIPKIPPEIAWKRIKRKLEANRGVFSDGLHDKWKLDFSENELREHKLLKSIPEHKYNSHEIASKIRDFGRNKVKTTQTLLETDEFLNYDFSKTENVEELGGIYYKTLGSIIKLHKKINGNLTISESKVIFSSNSIKVWNINDIIDIFKRRYLLQWIALEIFFLNGKSVFLTFSSLEILENVIKAFNKLGITLVNVNKRLKNCTKLWQSKRISNFEYLMSLNTLSGRTFNDISQYPIFPWIIKDFENDELDLDNPETFRDLSKPIGIQNLKMEKFFKERFQGFIDPEIPPFHYGSHYSNPGNVAYFLIRLEPFTSIAIELQGGSFDRSDRLFFSIESTWNLTTSQASVVTELIPEFFYLSEFLTNINKFDLGKRQDGEEIKNVELPKWAKNPIDFIIKHRKALESDYVTEHLPEWIDLIFGYKQRGPNALTSVNIFYYLCYEGTIDLESLEPKRRDAMKEQIRDFGQIPVQLFTEKHPFVELIEIKQDTERICFSMNISKTPIIFISFSKPIVLLDLFGFASKLVCIDCHGHVMNNRWLYSEGGTPNLEATDQSFEIINRDTISQNLKNVMVSCRSTNRLFIGNYLDNSFQIWSLENKELLHIIDSHKGTVTAIDLDKNFLVTGSSDTTCRIWDISNTSIIQKSICMGHKSPISLVKISKFANLVVSVSEDKDILLHNIHNGRLIRVIQLQHSIHHILLLYDSILIYCHSTFYKYSFNGQIINSLVDTEDFLSTWALKVNDYEIDSVLNNKFSTRWDNPQLVCARIDGTIDIRSIENFQVISKINVRRNITSIEVYSDSIFVGTNVGELVVVK